MLSKPLIAFANCYDFNILEDYAYGKIGNYLVSVTNSGYKKVAFITFFAFEEEQGENLLRFKLSEEIKKASIAALNDYEVCEDGLLIRTGEDLKSFDEAVVTACKIIEKLGFSGVEKCTYCGVDTDIENCFVCFEGTKALLLCEECAGDYLAKQEQKKIETAANQSKKRGVLAAFATALIGLIVFIGIYIFAIPYGGIKGADGDVVVKSMLFTMPFSALLTALSFLAYRLFTGRKGAERLLPCSITSLLASTVMTYATSAVLYTKMFGLSFAQAAKVKGIILLAPFKDIYFRKEFLQYLLYSVLAVIAVSLIYSIVFEDKKKPASFIVRYGSDEKLSSLAGAETETASEKSGENPA